MAGDPADPPEIPEDSLTCDICGQRFDTVDSLEEHKSAELHEAALKQKGVD
jgi:predicted nucleic acid-binding Zn ribbon protein